MPSTASLHRFAFLSALLLAGCAQQGGPQTPLVVRIGHAGPLSGPQAHFGRDNENGVRMALDELNAQGTTIGGRAVRFELVSRDDASDPRQGPQVAQAFCSDKVAGVVGPLNSGTTVPALPVYEQCGLPHITPSATNPRITRLGYRTSFRLLPDDDRLAALIALHAADVLHVRQVSVLSDGTAYGNGAAKAFHDTAREKGLQVLFDATARTPQQLDAALRGAAEGQPDAIFYGGMDTEAARLLREMQSLGMTHTLLLGSDGVCLSELAKLAAGVPTLDNVVCAMGDVAMDSMRGGRAWKARYDSRFPGQFQAYSPYTYDATYVLVQAMKDAGSADPRVYLPYLAKVTHAGLTGDIAFDAHGDLLHPRATFFTFRGGRKTRLN